MVNCNNCFKVLVIIIDNIVLYVCIMHLNPVIYSDSGNHNLENRPEIINFSETIKQRNHPADIVKNLAMWFDADFLSSEHIQKTCKACFLQMRDLGQIR